MGDNIYRGGRNGVRTPMLEFLNPANRKVLAYLRGLDTEQVLCVANLSRFAQPVDLDVSKLQGAIPVEMLGYVEFPRIGRQPS